MQGAIASWQSALTAYQCTNHLAKAAIVREKLAIAYQQIGQFELAIDYWQQALANSSQLGDFRMVGRLLAELAQTYSRLGLSSKIALYGVREHSRLNTSFPLGSRYTPWGSIVCLILVRETSNCLLD